MYTSDAKMFALCLHTVGSNQRILGLRMQLGFPCDEDHLASHPNDRLEGQDWKLGTSWGEISIMEIGEDQVLG